MRFSILANDRGYDPKRARRVKHVTVDGRVVTDFITADEEQGYVDKLVPDLSRPGQFKRDPANPDHFVVERVSGKTVIAWRTGDRDWDPSRKASGVRVAVGRDVATGDILVQVYSVVRPGAIKQGRMHFSDLAGLSESQVSQKAGLTGGMLAEMLCEQFGDTIDPHEAARVAVAQCALMLADSRSVIVDPTRV